MISFRSMLPLVGLRGRIHHIIIEGKLNLAQKETSNNHKSSHLYSFVFESCPLTFCPHLPKDSLLIASIITETLFECTASNQPGIVTE